MKRLGFPRFSTRAVASGSLTLLLMLALAGCKNKNEITDLWFGEDQPVLYAGDTEALSVQVEPETASRESLTWTSDNPTVAKVSGSGIVTALGLGRAIITVTTSDGQRATSHALTVSPSVYAVGFEKNAKGKQVATLWKNGVAQRLGDEDTDSAAGSVFVAGDDVYVVGSAGDKIKRAILWKNGAVAKEFGDENTSYIARSVFVSGEDVYMVGNTSTSFVGDTMSSAMLWKNEDSEALHLLGYGGSGIANSVFVSGKDVYVAGVELGYNEFTAVLWKNKTPQKLDFNASADSVCVSGKDVYVSGYVRTFDDKYYPAVWKNGEQLIFGTGKAKPVSTSIYALGNTIYFASCETGSGTTEVWITTTKDKPIKTTKMYLGSISLAKNAAGQNDGYMVGSELNAGKWYAYIGEPGFPATRANYKRLTDGTQEAKANALFLK